MTAKEAIDKAMQKVKFEIGDQYFTLIGWKSPHTGQRSGPFVVTSYGDMVVEVGPDGKFKEIYSGKADCYFPYIEERSSNNKVRKALCKVLAGLGNDD